MSVSSLLKPGDSLIGRHRGVGEHERVEARKKSPNSAFHAILTPT
jgi:hypothetical protein